MNFLILFALFVAFTIGLNLGFHGFFYSYHIPADLSEKTSSFIQLPISTKQIEKDIIKKTTVVEQLPPKKEDTNKLPLSNKIPVSFPMSPIKEEQKGKLLDQKITELYSEISTFIEDKQIIFKDTTALTTNIPVLLLTCNRPSLLEQTIHSLLSVRGINKNNIIVSQDGNMAQIAKIIHDNDLTLIQNLEGLRLRGGPAADGAARIASHYKFSLNEVFRIKPDAKAAIIVEDDLLFSPDFYEYFTSVAPILEADKSAFIISAWSDNGFKDKVKNPFSLHRTDYFPGLGWLLTRDLYENELQKTWPRNHWDHWLRSDSVSKHRDIIYPQIPRSYHNGIKGTFMNLDTHNKYFRDIGYNTDSSVQWGQATIETFKHTYKEAYDQRLILMMKRCKSVRDISEFLSFQDEILCVWVDSSTNCDIKPVAFEPISSFFGIWHEHRRGNYRGIHEFYWEQNYLLLINVHTGIPGNQIFQEIRNPEGPILKPRDFSKTRYNHLKKLKTNLKGTKATDKGLNCNEVCSAIGKRCDVNQIPWINSCHALNEAFPCSSCGLSIGPDQPAFEPDQGKCWVATDSTVSTCEGTHPATVRLCPCQ